MQTSINSYSTEQAVISHGKSASDGFETQNPNPTEADFSWLRHILTDNSTSVMNVRRQLGKYAVCKNLPKYKKYQHSTFYGATDFRKGKIQDSNKLTCCEFSC